MKVNAYNADRALELLRLSTGQHDAEFREGQEAAIRHVKDTAEQKSMENSTQQARNVDGVVAVSQAPLPGPVLLLDDLVDSRWTLTLAAWLLRSRGGGPVWPFALASTGHD